jgi:polar amino acid transport system permease protein
MTWGSERVLNRLYTRLSHGQATLAGERQRKAAA